MRRKYNILNTLVNQVVLLIVMSSIRQRENRSIMNKKWKFYKRNWKFRQQLLKRRYRIEGWFLHRLEIKRKHWIIKKMGRFIRMNIFVDFYLFLFFLGSSWVIFESYEPIILNLNNLFSSIVIKNASKQS